jgi:N-acetylmuramoyl-L-alanine amidase
MRGLGAAIVVALAASPAAFIGARAAGRSGDGLAAGAQQQVFRPTIYPGQRPRTLEGSSTLPPAVAGLPTAQSHPPAGDGTVPPVAVLREPAANLAGGFSMARQLGLGISRIVIDPGHGGRDPGAQGHGITEADLTLDVALRLEALLKKQPGIDVVLTRRTDVYVPLEERTAIANRAGADLFLSIHANASLNTQAHGIETYFLNFASDADEAAVAARENAASGDTMGNLPDLVKAIALNNKLNESRDFATMVQQAMYSGVRARNADTRDLGVKQAPFVVLIGAAMPSVLAEISFVTNDEDARYLKRDNFREAVAQSLLSGIVRYQRALKAARTASQ